MFIKILLVVVVLLIVLIVAILRQSDEFRVTRSTTINAPADVVYTQVNEKRKWQAWSPWVKMDPNARYTFEGPESGVGAITRWEGTKSGAGSSTITEARPNEFLRFRLDFLKPMQATNTTEFTFKSEGSATTVTWTMYGKNNFMSKAIGLLMNCEKMVGDQFEQGLASMKAVSEAQK